MCRYGSQDVYRLTGRDPIKSPLTNLERALFCTALLEYMKNEAGPPPPGGSPG